MKRYWLYPIGFVLFVLGITSTAMTLIGVRWAFLGWIDRFSASLQVPILGFLIKILMILVGAVCVYFAGFDWEREREESL